MKHTGMLLNPDASVEPLRLQDGRVCLVIDEMLLEPDSLVQFAATQRNAFRAVDFNFYPGVFLDPPQQFPALLANFFNTRVRRHFDARRLLQMHCRLSMVTKQPEELSPMQCLCHRDRPTLDARHCIQACILYLFRDAGLGGTTFYRPVRSEEETRQLFADAHHLPSAQFFSKYNMLPHYLAESNSWFERVASVPARWNRCIFFDGFGFHSGDIPMPEKLSADPLTGRLTVNGFFTSRRHLR
jgi:hypothetical protein